jgi:hypothetical protein
MKVSGFTFVRNAVKFAYPVRASILSVLPLCDEFVISVGHSDDGTLELIQSIDSPKIKIVHSLWDDALREGGRILAVETDKAYAAVSPDADWAFYIQADELLHEQYLETVRDAMERHKDDRHVDGLLFKYRHFYGSYDYVGESYSWYRREIRVVRKRADIFSYRDAQGFRKLPNEKLRVKPIDAYIYHYGWVRPPKAMFEKHLSFGKLYHGEQWRQGEAFGSGEFDYSGIDALSRFTGTHPAVFQEEVKKINWKFDFDLSKNRFRWKDRLKRFVEKYTGWRPGEYRNYKII